jgi:fatty-acyl-CoA synthase
MLSYVHGSALTPLLGQTIGESLNRAAAQFGDRDALISCHQDLKYTYSELLHHVNRAARALLRLGVERGDRVGIWSPNTAEWMISQFAAAKVGAILVNINPSYQLRELEYALNQSGLTVLISARKFRKSDYVGMLESLMPEVKERRGAMKTWTQSRAPALSAGVISSRKATPSMTRRSPAANECSSSTIQLISSTRQAQPARRKVRRSRITTS